MIAPLGAVWDLIEALFKIGCQRLGVMGLSLAAHTNGNEADEEFGNKRG
jgi:hypothetical protein